MKIIMVEDVDEEKPLCETEIRMNIIRAEVGEPLTRPLSFLKKNCEFMKYWNRITKNENNKIYLRKPEVKLRYKIYYQKNKDKYRAYHKLWIKKHKKKKEVMVQNEE